MKIKQAATQLNVSQKTIRYYEQCGLITPVKEMKIEREFRDYDEETMARLRAVIVLRKLRFTIEEIQRIFEKPESISEICDVHRKQMAEDIASMTDICTLLDEVAQKEIEDGQSLAMEIENHHKKMVLDRSLEMSDLSKYDESFIDYDLLEEDKTAEQSSRVALAVNQYFANFKAVFRLSDREEPGKRKYVILFSILVLTFLFVFFFDIFRRGGGEPEPVPKEVPVVLSAADFNLTEQDYAEMEQIKADIRERLIEHPDPELYSEIKGSLDFGRRSDKYYVSCIPVLGWSYYYERGELAYGLSLGLWAFGDRKKNAYDAFLLHLDRDKEGKFHVSAGSTRTLDSMQKNPTKRYIMLCSETSRGYCFLREDGKVYDQDCSVLEHVQIKGDLCKRFDWDRMSVCYEEIVKPENRAVFKFKEGGGL